MLGRKEVHMTDRDKRNNINKAKGTRKNKKIILAVLFATSVFITAAGLLISVVSIINNISFTVFQSQIPGAIFGLVIVFLGARYFYSVLKLKPELLKEENKFSWDNFKKKSHV
jgi:hypothetical protein